MLHCLQAHRRYCHIGNKLFAVFKKTTLRAGINWPPSLGKVVKTAQKGSISSALKLQKERRTASAS